MTSPSAPNLDRYRRPVRTRPSLGDVRRVLRPVDLLTIAILVVLVLSTVAEIGDRNGAFTYQIDDAYIHLAMAETFAEDHTWGLRPGVVESASSSPGYTTVLALATALPLDNVWLPLLLNLAAGAALLLLVVWATGARTPRARAAVGIAAIFALALVPLSLLGMEVLPHAVVVGAFVAAVSRSTGDTGRPGRWLLAILAGALVTLRLESAFLVAGAAVLLFAVGSGSLRSRLRTPTWIAAGGLTALLVMVLLHVAGGQFPLPNSVVAKSRVVEDGDRALLRPLQDPVGAVEILGRNLHSNPRLMWAIAACLLVVALPRLGLGVRVAAGTVLIGYIGQSWYAFTFDRYGEGLVAGGVVVAALAAGRIERGRASREPGLPAWAAWCLPALVLALAQLSPTDEIVDAASSVHRQQEQMARFLEEHHLDDGVAVNDLGFVAWRHEGPLLDLLGLGSVDVVRTRRDHGGELPVDEMERLANEHGVEIVVVFRNPEKFFPDGLPASWEPVLDWCLEGSIGVAGDRCVTWFATPLGDADELRANLDDYAEELPAGVEVLPADP